MGLTSDIFLVVLANKCELSKCSNLPNLLGGKYQSDLRENMVI